MAADATKLGNAQRPAMSKLCPIEYDLHLRFPAKNVCSREILRNLNTNVPKRLHLHESRRAHGWFKAGDIARYVVLKVRVDV